MVLLLIHILVLLVFVYQSMIDHELRDDVCNKYHHYLHNQHWNQIFRICHYEKEMIKLSHYQYTILLHVLLMQWYFHRLMDNTNTNTDTNLLLIKHSKGCDVVCKHLGLTCLNLLLSLFATYQRSTRTAPLWLPVFDQTTIQQHEIPKGWITLFAMICEIGCAMDHRWQPVWTKCTCNSYNFKRSLYVKLFDQSKIILVHFGLIEFASLRWNIGWITSSTYAI